MAEVTAMTRDELRDALDGLHAYDGGATDSGIHDETLRAKCRAAVTADPKLIQEFAVELYGQPPYSDEDRQDFIEWANLDL